MTSADRASLHFALVDHYSSLDEILQLRYLGFGFSLGHFTFTSHPTVSYRWTKHIVIGRIHMMTTRGLSLKV